VLHIYIYIYIYIYDISRLRVNHVGFEVLEHPAYSPDLAPSGYHLFGPLKNALRGRRFSTDKEVREAVHKWLRDQL